MDNRVWASGAAASPPTAPASPSVGYPSPGDPLTATPASKGGAFWFHQLGEELRAILTAAGITPDHEDLTQVLASINILISAKTAQLQGRNVIVNGCCSISQVNGTTEVTPATGVYPIDNVQYAVSQASKLKCDQTASLMGALGAVWSLRTTVLAKYTPIASDKFNMQFPIEGLNFARFQYGTANAKSGSLQFKALPSVAGTYSGCIANYAETRSYPFSFTVSAGDIAAGGKLVKIENIPGDTGGAWVGATNAGAAGIIFDLGCGSNFKGAAGAWTAGDVRGVTGALALVDQVNGSTLSITDVQFEVGAFCTQFERKLYDQNLSECQRYLPSHKFNSVEGPFGQARSPTASSFQIQLVVPARVPPTGLQIIAGGGNFNVTTATGTSVATANPTFNAASVNGIKVDATGSGLTAGYASQLHNNTGMIVFTGAQI